jgi:CRP/FNR family transcriptional regulator, cyclic AMP receptor protein
MMRRKRHELAEVPLFAACDPYELDMIWDVARRVEFAPGEALAVEGETGDAFVVILRGTADVTIGNEQVRTLGPGDYFGEVALLDGGPRTATVIAATPIDAYEIKRANFRWVIQNAPTLTESLLLGVAARLREATGRQLH